MEGSGDVTRIVEVKVRIDKFQVHVGRTVQRLDESGEKKDESNITLRILTCTGGPMLESLTAT